MEQPTQQPDVSLDCSKVLTSSEPELDAYDHCINRPDSEQSIQHPSTSGGLFLEVERRHASELSYEDFVVHYMSGNKPVLIQGCTDDWPCRRQWVTPDGAPDIDALEALAGASCVCVTDTSRQAYYGTSAVQEMTLSQYAAWWRQHVGDGSSDAADGHAGSSAPGAATADPGSCPSGLYLKDWHYVSEFSENKAYRLPLYFSDDWLNAYYDHRAAQQAAGGSSSSLVADYRFVYLGPAGTWTPVHHDVLCSYSWSANVCGRKRWLLLPPEHTSLLRHRRGHCLAPHMLQEELPAGEAAEDYPRLAAARAHLYEVVQEAGEALFVPSCWHHVVRNEAATLSINHNWLNGHNLHWVWGLLRAQYREAAAMIEDCRPLCTPPEFEALVQRNLGANAGLDLRGLLDLLEAVALRNVSGSAGSARQVVDEHAIGAVVGSMLGTLRQEPTYRQLLQWEQDGQQDSGDASGAGGGSSNHVAASSSAAAEAEAEDVGSRGDEAVVGAIAVSLQRLYDHLCAGRKVPGVACV